MYFAAFLHKLLAVNGEISVFVALEELSVAAGVDAVAWHQALQLRALQKAAVQAGAPVAQGVVVRKSLDARKGFPIGYRVVVKYDGAAEPISRLSTPRHVSGSRHVVVVGSGPAGVFAALRLAQAGVRVTLLEQGKAVQPRRHDLAALTRGTLVASSNYCFGEGGAGTFSDGKLYTRSKDKSAIHEVLSVLVAHGADEGILVDSRPHIGSNRLPQILVALRHHLTELQVQYEFEQNVTQLIVHQSKVKGVQTAKGDAILADAVVLAVGHSARPMYHMLFQQGVVLEPKSFAVGVRVEHPQPLIDRMQYGKAFEHPALPAAFYHLTATCMDRGVYTFCMCPGGWVVPSATEPGGVCVNGMSLKRRDSPFANSALVVSVTPKDCAESVGFGISPILAGMVFQKRLEEQAFAYGGGAFVAPTQLVSDAVQNRPSHKVLLTSYRPGGRAGHFASLLPAFVWEPLRQALFSFNKTMPGFVTPQAQLIGVETRTSAPVRIVRDDSLQSPSMRGLFPCGEGAGYAGGIVSAAIDGLRVADGVLQTL